MTEQQWMTSTDPAALLRLYTSDDMPWPHGTPAPMVSSRKLRLFACACCYQVWDQLTDDRSRRAVEVAERFADGEATEDELSKARSEAADARNWGNESPESYPQWAAHVATCIGPESIISVVTRQTELSQLVPPATQAALLRDIVGNPFRPVRRAVYDNPGCPNKGSRHPRLACTCPPWLTPQVLAVARTIYADRAFADLPILADALEDAGCDDEELLRHLRGEEWVPCDNDCRITVGDTKGIYKVYEDGGPESRWVVCPECRGKGGNWIPLRGPHVCGCWALDLVLGKE